MYNKHIPRRRIEVKNHPIKFGGTFKDSQLYPKIRKAQQVMRHPPSCNSGRKR